MSGNQADAMEAAKIRFATRILTSPDVMAVSVLNGEDRLGKPDAIMVVGGNGATEGEVLFATALLMARAESMADRFIDNLRTVHGDE